METCMSSRISDDDTLPSVCSMSYGALVQQSTSVLKNECAMLEARIEEKTRSLEEIKKVCSRQYENIVKQQSELEHYKVKTHSEEMQNKTHMTKIRNLREQLQVLDKYFEKWGQTINPMLGYKNDLEEKIKQLKEREEMEEARIDQLNKENDYYIEGANKAFLALQEHREREKTELCELKAHLSNQLEQQKLQERDLEKELRELQSICREKEIMINILEPQRTELKNKFENLETELIAVKEEIKITNVQLEASLKEVLERKTKLHIEIESVTQNINEVNNLIREKEQEIKTLDSTHKQINAEEEEYIKLCENEQLALKELECTVEELTSQFSARMKIETENITLKSVFDDLQKENIEYKEKIAEVERNEEAYQEKIEGLIKEIEKMDIELRETVNERNIIEEALSKLEGDREKNENEHKDLSSKIDKLTSELQDKNNQLKISFWDLSEQLSEANEMKNQFEILLKNLESELIQAKLVLQQSDFKLSSFYEISTTVTKNFIEKIQILNEIMQRSIEDHEKAAADCKHNEEVKRDICQIEKEINSKCEQFSQTIKKLQDSFAIEIENKSKTMAESRAQCELQYRNKEVLKTDALVELRETKARIIELQKQNAQIEKEIVVKAEILRKCDNLIHKMMSKFNKVAQVAITSSQSVVDPTSQPAILFATPSNHRKPMKVQSPGSDSSGKTFNPDDVDAKKISQNRPILGALPTSTNPKTMFKKRSIRKDPTQDVIPSKKKVVREVDDWGFLV